MRTRLAQDQRGAAAVEVAIVFGVLLVLTISLIEFALALWQWNSAEKATQLGVRYAVESDPVATAFTSYSGVTDGNFQPGTSLDTSTVAAFTVRCTSSGCICPGGCGAFGGNPGSDAVAFTAIVDKMQGIFPRIQPANVVVKYSHVGMGFAGRLGGDLVPTVTLELQGLTFDFLLLSFLGPAGVPMPAFAATLTGEDLASAGPS